MTHFGGLDLGYLPILAVQTAKITTGGCQGKGLGPGLKMIQRFFFYGVNMQGTWVTVSQAVKTAVYVDPGSTHAAVTGGQDAAIRADTTDHPVAFQFFIEIPFMGPFPGGCRCITFKYLAFNIIRSGYVVIFPWQKGKGMAGKGAGKQRRAVNNKMSSANFFHS